MIMLDTIEIDWLVLAAAASVVVVGLLLALMFLLARQQARLVQAQKQIESLSANLAALCAGAAGADKRINRLEQHSRDLRSRQDSLASQGRDEGAYGEAIQMVRQGATVSRLVEELDLGRNEAELIVMLHGMKKAG
ncbi:MAG TPA: DUF2802 domain-containing protein [Sedimenticola sp.]|nr:DUF2802 domain-containing protein [Sedimenticola sp.]